MSSKFPQTKKQMLSTSRLDDASIQKLWKEHFQQLLNVNTHNDPMVLTKLSIDNTEEQISHFLQEEVTNAIYKIKTDEAPGMV